MPLADRTMTPSPSVPRTSPEALAALALTSWLMHGGTSFPHDPLRVSGKARLWNGKPARDASDRCNPSPQLAVARRSVAFGSGP